MMGNKIFEIPVYAMPKKVFYKRWEKVKNKTLDMFVSSGWKENEAKRTIDQLYFPYTVFDYNQIIGYLIISINSNDVFADYFYTEDEVFRIASKRRHFMSLMPSIDHLRIYGCTNNEIADKIKELVDDCKSYIDKRFYIDDEIFNRLLYCVDYNRIISET